MHGSPITKKWHEARYRKPPADTGRKPTLRPSSFCVIPARLRKCRIQFPMCVLINTGTYREAELCAAVLKDFQWATLVGTPTTGNTRSQETIELEDGSAIRLSTHSYLTPNGVDISASGGVVPDSIVYNTDESATGTTMGTTGGQDGTASISADEQLMAALRFLS